MLCMCLDSLDLVPVTHVFFVHNTKMIFMLQKTQNLIKQKTTVVHIGPASYRDVTKRARSLAEQTSCLATKTNDLGYKCEPLFGDLFDYQDYCVDTLHLKLRIFDGILKDILAHASRTGKYGVEHLSLIEEKIKVLNKHYEKTVGKRFFFKSIQKIIAKQLRLMESSLVFYKIIFSLIVFHMMKYLTMTLLNPPVSL